MARWQTVVRFLAIFPALTLAGRWYDFRILRNPGLSTAIASSSDACVNSCLQKQGCSAVSYQQSSRQCITSQCNNLDLFSTTGWNTYVIGSDNFLVEGVDVPAPQFEWMLTDTCGNSNQGVSDGPKMNLYSVTYAPSQSVSAGNAPVFEGTNTSYGETDYDTRLSNALGTNSMSVSLWANWFSLSDTTLLEYNDEERGVAFWYAYGGLFYNVDTMCSVTGCSANCAPNANTFTPISNAWYHIGYVYDGSKGTMTVYLNYSVVAMNNVGTIHNVIVWTRAHIAHAFFDKSGTMMGQLYCYKFHNAALTSDQMIAAGQSCFLGKIRMSSN